VWGVPATLTLFAIRLKKCCSVLQYNVKIRGAEVVSICELLLEKHLVFLLVLPLTIAKLSPVIRAKKTAE